LCCWPDFKEKPFTPSSRFLFLLAAREEPLLATRRAGAKPTPLLPVPVPWSGSGSGPGQKHVCHILGPTPAPLSSLSVSLHFNIQSKFSSNLLELGNLFSGRLWQLVVVATAFQNHIVTFLALPEI